MQDKERSSKFRISDAIQAERQSSGGSNRSVLSNTLLKGTIWKEDTLGRIATDQPQLTVAELEAEIARLVAEYDKEIKAKNAEMLEIQAAYDAFEEQSDRILDELDQENKRLRLECKGYNHRSVL